MAENIKKYFFCGIGGVGMSPLAHLIADEKNIVEGSDSNDQKTISNLRKKNIKCYIGHKAENINDVDYFVYSTAISNENVELQFAKNNNIKCLHRADVLAKLVNNQKGITIAGTHGKTTTSALTAFLLYKGGLDPTAAIGGFLPDFNGYHRIGKSDWIVAESDESDASFKKLKSQIGVVLNIDSDHLDFYKNLDEIIDAFKFYISEIKKNGTLIFNCDDDNITKLIPELNIKTVGYSIKNEADFFAKNIFINPLNSTFKVCEKETEYNIELSLPGEFNVSNAMAAIAAAREAGVAIKDIQKGCKEFKGIFRRFQMIGKFLDADVVDDYAHHPEEIKAVKKITDKIGKNTIAVFQPHRFTRTKSFINQFVDALSSFDSLILTDIFAASEKETDFSGKILFEEVLKKSKNKNVVFVKNLTDINDELNKIVKKDDLILFMGAGTISKTAHELVGKRNV